MPIESIHCHVLGAHVTRITGLEGEVVRLICAEYDEPHRRLPAEEGRTPGRAALAVTGARLRGGARHQERPMPFVRVMKGSEAGGNTSPMAPTSGFAGLGPRRQRPSSRWRWR